MNDIYELKRLSRLPVVCPGERASGTSCRCDTSGERKRRLPRIRRFDLRSLQESTQFAGTVSLIVKKKAVLGHPQG